MILQVLNQITLSHRLESSADSLVYCWFLEQNRHRNRFLQTASLDSLESLFQSKISVFQDFQTDRDDLCLLGSKLGTVKSYAHNRLEAAERRVVMQRRDR